MVDRFSLYFLLIFGFAVLTTSAAKIFYVLDNDRSEDYSLENDNQINSQESTVNKKDLGLLAYIINEIQQIQSDNSKVENEIESDNQLSSHESIHNKNDLRLLANIIREIKQMQSNIPEVETNTDNNDYDYNWYYKQKTCKGNNCVLLFPGKLPYVMSELDKDTSEDKSELITNEVNEDRFKEDEDDGYDRDDEGEEEITPIMRSRLCDWGKLHKLYSLCKLQLNSSTPLNMTFNLTIDTAPNATVPTLIDTATVPSSKKTFEEKTTDEVTSADMDEYIPDSFEQRSDKFKDQRKKMSTKQYTNLKDLLTYVIRASKQNKKGKYKSRDSESVSSEYSESTEDVLPDVTSKEIFKALRMNKQQKKAWARNKRLSTTRRPIESDDSDSDNVPAEDSDTEKDSGSSEKRQPQTKQKKSNRFKIVAHKKKTYGKSKDSSEEIGKRDTTETIENISEEVKPKPKKSKPRIPGKPEHYMQSPGRYIKEGTDFRKLKENITVFQDPRKRLPHFLPKRYHWDPSEFHKLGYFWFNGPQGKVPGPWKIAY